MSNADDTLPPSGPTLIRAFAALIQTLDQRKIRYAIIGGIAAIQHTRVRTTDDIDALLSLSQIQMTDFFQALKEAGFMLDVANCVKEFRDGGMTTVRFHEVLIDLLKPVLPLYAHVIERAVPATVFGHTVQISAAEGLIVMKLIAMRPQDEIDIRDLLEAYAGKLNLDFIRAELDTFAESDDPRRLKFEEWVRSAR